MTITRDDIAQATHAWRDHAIDGTPLGDEPICNCYQYADAIMPEVRRAQAEAWERSRREVRGIAHWYDDERKYGEFDLQPLGPDETSEKGAFMAVMGVLATNPYIEKEGAGA